MNRERDRLRDESESPQRDRGFADSHPRAEFEF